MMNLIIAVGLNEHVPRSANPRVPVTPKEIAQDARECVDAGATLLHLHARHATDGTTPRPALGLDETKEYMEIWDALEEVGVDVPVYMGVGSSYSSWAGSDDLSKGEDPAGYRCVLATAGRPTNRLEVAPVIAGSVDWYTFDPRAGQHLSGTLLRRSIEDAEYELEVARRYDMWVSHDIWEPGNMRIVFELYRRGLYDRPFLLKFFMAEYSSYGMPPEPRYLDTFVSMIPDWVNCEWLALPYGSSDRAARSLWAHAIGLGGHVRVGIGDNPGAEGDHFPGSNAERVEQVVRLANELGRPIATPSEVRARFGPLKNSH
jgi:3-keto-5-aminohexanoate cleavage enzyme